MDGCKKELTMFLPRPWQKRVIPRMIAGDIVLVWEPGVGKTWPVLSASQFVDGKTLIVVPAHLRLQWQRAAAEHAPLMRVVILEGLAEKIPASVFSENDIFVCSYEYVACLPRWKQLRRQKWGALAVDEVHYLMNLEADRTRAILGATLEGRHGLVYACDRVWALSGTPFQFPNQIYPLLSRVFPDAIRRPAEDGPGLMTAREWENRFCKVVDKEDGFGVKIVGARNVPELRSRLAPVLDKQKLILAKGVTLTVDDIPIQGNLKELLRGVAPEVVAEYRALEAILLDDDIPDAEKMAALSESGLVMAEMRHNIAVAKIKETAAVAKHVRFTGTKKVLIFGWHKKPLAELAKLLGGAPVISGATTPKQKDKALDAFITGDAGFLLGQIGAIGTGTDGLQEVCHRSLFFETPWTYRENKQCIHRTFRTGQIRPCHVSYITLAGTVDDYVAKTLKRNAKIIREILD